MYISHAIIFDITLHLHGILWYIQTCFQNYEIFTLYLFIDTHRYFLLRWQLAACITKSSFRYIPKLPRTLNLSECFFFTMVTNIFLLYAFSLDNPIIFSTFCLCDAGQIKPDQCCSTLLKHLKPTENMMKVCQNYLRFQSSITTNCSKDSSSKTVCCICSFKKN